VRVEFFDRRYPRVGFVQLLQQPAKRQFAIGVAHRLEAAMQSGVEFFQVAVVGEDPVAPPKFTGKRVAVFEGDGAHGGLAHMGYDVMTFDRVRLEHLRNRRGRSTFLVHKMPSRLAGLVAFALKEGDAPTI